MSSSVNVKSENIAYVYTSSFCPLALADIASLNCFVNAEKLFEKGTPLFLAVPSVVPQGFVDLFYKGSDRSTQAAHAFAMWCAKPLLRVEFGLGDNAKIKPAGVVSTNELVPSGSLYETFDKLVVVYSSSVLKGCDYLCGMASMFTFGDEASKIHITDFVASHYYTSILTSTIPPAEVLSYTAFVESMKGNVSEHVVSSLTNSLPKLIGDDIVTARCLSGRLPDVKIALGFMPEVSALKDTLPYTVNVVPFIEAVISYLKETSVEDSKFVEELFDSATSCCAWVEHTRLTCILKQIDWSDFAQNFLPETYIKPFKDNGVTSLMLTTAEIPITTSMFLPEFFAAFSFVDVKLTSEVLSVHLDRTNTTYEQYSKLITKREGIYPGFFDEVLTIKTYSSPK